MLRVGLCLAGLALVAGATSAAPLNENPRYEPLVEAWRSRMDLYDVPGAAIAVIEDGQTYVQTLGVRDEAGAPVTPETIFYIASMTKTYVATLAAMLAEQGALSLDEKVTTYLPRFDLAGDGEASITVRDLLSHRPGITSGEVVLLDAYTGEITEDRYYHWLARVTPTFETTYSNVHFTLLGRIIEAITDADWRDALDVRLFTPAGLAHTTGYVSEMYAGGNGAVPMERDGDGWRSVAQRKTDRTMHAAGGLGTSIEDAARYLTLQLDEGRIDGTRLFSAETADEIRREQSTIPPDGTLRIMTGFGLGWQRGTFNDVPFFAHGGGYEGTNTYFAFLPEQHAAFAVLVNAGGLAGGWGAAVAVDLFETLTDTEAEWKPWERFGERAQQIQTERAEAPPASETPAVPELSRPVGLYTGSFRNPWLGTLTVSWTGDALELHLGDRTLVYEPDGVDQVRLTELTEPPAPCKLIVDAHGRIDRISIDDADWGEMIFER